MEIFAKYSMHKSFKISSEHNEAVSGAKRRMYKVSAVGEVEDNTCREALIVQLIYCQNVGCVNNVSKTDCFHEWE